MLCVNRCQLHWPTYIKSLGSSIFFFMKEIPIFKIVKDHAALKTGVMASENNIFKYNKIENHKILLLNGSSIHTISLFWTNVALVSHH